jgi:dephospho-CoA kinase
MSGMRVVGLTGGIGSGKSTIAAMLRARGIPVVDADLVARDCTAPGTPGLAAVLARFGPGVLTADGALDRAALAAVVFADATARRDLEAITHPCIRAGIADRLRELAAGTPPPPLAVVEHPLLVETGGTAGLDSVVVVEAPAELRVARTVAGRRLTAEDVRARIASQTDDAARRAAADHVLVNDGGLAALERAVGTLLARLGDEPEGPARGSTS